MFHKFNVFSKILNKFLFLLLLCSCFVLVSCGESGEVVMTNSLDFTNVIKVEQGKTKGLEAIFDENATIDLQWSSSDVEIISVNVLSKATCEIKGLKVGEATITLIDNISGLFQMYVFKVTPAIKDIITKSLSLSSINKIDINEEKVVTVSYDQKATVSIKWSVSDNSILEIVDESMDDCKVKGLKEGTVTLTAHDNFSGIDSSVEILVYKYVHPDVEVTESSILKGTAMETPVYLFKTNVEGPKIAIVGGIHGDEVAGWNAALQLVESLKNNKGICGEILLIPEANILADKAKTRYKVTGYNFSDLNRSFPKDRNVSATSETIKISDAIIRVVNNFNPDYIIDLHESQHSWTEMEQGTYTSLGDTLIASNQGRFIRQIINRYNDYYKPADETNFRREESNQKGSFNYYYTNLYPEKVVFTIETNRLRIGGVDTIDVSKRVRQQLNILEAFFDYAWNRL